MDKATNHNFPELFHPKMIKKIQKVSSIQICSQNFINFHAASLSISEKINIGLRKQT